jgi:hypothetical protein
MQPIQTQPFHVKPIQTQPFHANRSRNLKALIAFLLMVALVDSYALARAYVARNADTIVIVATDYNNVAGGPAILKVITQRYTGATARKIELAIDTAHYLKPGWNVGTGCTGGAGSDHVYGYQMTFTLAGIVTEVVTTATGGCRWTRSILGLSEAATITNGGNPLFAISQITNGALPT